MNRLTAEQRATLADIGDVILPASGDLPAASQAGVHLDLIDRVLVVAPDLFDGLVSALERAAQGGVRPSEHLQNLHDERDEDLRILVTAVGAAYYLNEQVRSTIGYPGQAPTPVNAGADLPYAEDGTLDHVLERGDRFILP